VQHRSEHLRNALIQIPQHDTRYLYSLSKKLPSITFNTRSLFPSLPNPLLFLLLLNNSKLLFFFYFFFVASFSFFSSLTVITFFPLVLCSSCFYLLSFYSPRESHHIIHHAQFHHALSCRFLSLFRILSRIVNLTTGGFEVKEIWIVLIWD
jgi:hypothetical protein